MRVLVPGAQGVLGGLIATALEEAGHEVTRTSREPGADLQLDLNDEGAVRAAAEGHDAAILCPILSVSGPACRWLAEEGVSRIVAFSSNNVSVDMTSSVYARLRLEEEALQSLGDVLTILRPTMIYGYPGDGNLSKLMGFASRWGFLPCPGSGRALQQPVHVKDVARAAVHALVSDAEHGPFVVSGSATPSSADLFSAILTAAGKNPGSVLQIPLWPLQTLAAATEAMGARLPLSAAQLVRFEQDKLAVCPALPGFTPEISLEEGLRDLKAALADQG